MSAVIAATSSIRIWTKRYNINFFRFSKLERLTNSLTQIFKKILGVFYHLSLFYIIENWNKSQKFVFCDRCHYYYSALCL